MPLVTSFTKQGIIGRVVDQGIAGRVVNQGVVAVVDETLDEIFPPIPPVIATTLESIDTPNDPGEVTLGFAYSDADGTVDKVELFQRFNLGAAVSIQVFEPPDPSPFQHQVTGLAQGDYIWFAVATDNDDASTPSNMVQATIGSADAKLTFTAPKVYANAEPLLENGNWKPYILSAGRFDQVSGKGEAAKSGAEWAFIQKEEDLKLRGKYIVRWKWRMVGPNFNLFAFAGISGAKLTAGEATNGTFFGTTASGKSIFYMFPLLGSGEIGHIDLVHTYRNLSNSLVNLKVAVSSTAWPQSLEVTDELEYDGTDIFWRSDIGGLTGFTPAQRNTTISIAGNVRDMASHHLIIGLPHTNTGSGMTTFLDDVEVITVP